MVFGVLRAHIHELQVRTPQVGTVSTNLTVGTSAAEQMLCAQMTNTIVLLDGALVTENEADRPMDSELKGIRLNVVALPQETLYDLQDGITIELWARESHTL